MFFKKYPPAGEIHLYFKESKHRQAKYICILKKVSTGGQNTFVFLWKANTCEQNTFVFLKKASTGGQNTFVFLKKVSTFGHSLIGKKKTKQR